jgi:hypothetical protein
MVVSIYNVMNFKEWLVSESQNPQILLPYIKHRKERRMEGKMSISDDHLRMDYVDGMDRLAEIFAKDRDAAILHRKAMRQYEITRDRMHEKARKESQYMNSYSDSEPDNDLWLFVSALEDMSRGQSPSLEKFL